MRDLLFLAITFGFFAVAAAFVAACERTVGRAASELERERRR
jgi:hypothetical protein